MHSSVVGRIVEHRSGSESRVQSTRAPERCWGAKPCCGALHCGGAGDTGAFHIHTTGVPNGNSGHCGALERRVADRTESTGIEPSESTGIDGNRTVGIDGNRRSDGWPTGRRLWTHWGA